MQPSAIEPLAAAVKAARSLGIRDAQVSVAALERACAELRRLTDELDAADSSSDRAATEWHNQQQRISRAQAAVAELKHQANTDPNTTRSLATHEAALHVEKALAATEEGPAASE